MYLTAKGKGKFALYPVVPWFGFLCATSVFSVSLVVVSCIPITTETQITQIQHDHHTQPSLGLLIASESVGIRR
jgi:hypothetical protein